MEDQEAGDMNVPNQSNCPKCGSPIPGDAPRGLCPKCVLEGVASAANAHFAQGRQTHPPAIEEIAPHFPELEILELLGVGGMGVVYKARQRQLDRMVALKILSHDLSSDPAFAERFNREARMLARLGHPNIVGIFDFGTAGPHPYLLMEYVDGVNLRQAMRTGGFTPTEALALVQEICSALKFAHEAGILHRDIKPENILIDSKGRVKIADFGIAKLVGEESASDVTLTMQGSILGSPHYMAPEQIEKPGEVDQRADIYSLGVVLYEMLTGELPIGRFAAPSAKAAMDARIDEIVMRTLEKEREARFQTAEEVSTSVGALAKSPPIHSQVLSSHQTSDHGSARFSLLSAALTFISIIFGIIVAYLFATFGETQVVIRNIGAGWALLNLVATLGTASTGFILGAWALGDIRRSGGRKTGAGFAIFAVILWPLLLLGAFGMQSIRIPLSEEHGDSVSISMVVLPVLGGALVAAAFVLIRGLRRWARGVSDKNGGKRFPGLAAPILAALGIMVLAIASLDVIGQDFSRSEEGSLRHPEISKMLTLGSDTLETSSVSKPADWRGGIPDLKMNILVETGFKATMKMLLEDENGVRNLYSFGEATPNQDGTPGHASIELGTLLDGRVESESAKQAMTVLFSSGGKRSQTQSQLDLRGFDFSDSPKDVLLLEEVGTQRISLATRYSDGRDKITGFLYLEVKVTLE